jgi:hypothetical protein
MTKESAHTVNFGKDATVFHAAHSLTIKNGNKYEKTFTTLFTKKYPGSILSKDELNTFIQFKVLPSRSNYYILYIDKNDTSQTAFINSCLCLDKKPKPDHVILDNNNHIIYVLQEKSSAELDTTNGPGSVSALLEAATNLQKIFCISYTVKPYLIGWTVKDDATLLSNMKNLVSKDNIMTGSALCNLFSINYADVFNAVSPKVAIKENQQNAAISFYKNIKEETSIAKFILEEDAKVHQSEIKLAVLAIENLMPSDAASIEYKLVEKVLIYYKSLLR